MRAMGGRRAALALRLLLALLPLAGCARHFFQDPKVDLREATVTGFSSTGANLTLDFNVLNPNRVRLPLRGVDYKVWVNGARFLEGTESRPVDVPAHGAARVTLPVTLRYDDFVNVLKSLKDHPRPVYDIEAQFRFAVPLVGTVRVPVREHREIPFPQLKIPL